MALSSVVMLHDNTSDDLLFSVIFRSFLQRHTPIRNRSLPPPCPRKGRLLVKTTSLNANALQDRAVHEGQEWHIVVGHRKVECTKPVIGTLVVRRLHDAVDGGFVKSAGEKLNHVTRVDDLLSYDKSGISQGDIKRTDQRIVDMSNPTPFAVR